LRKGFEVCGILKEVVVPSRRNAIGEVYGFVCFSKVRDIGKLLKAVNAVCFGSYRVRAKVAHFDRSVEVEGNSAKEGEDVGGDVNIKKFVEGVKMTNGNRLRCDGEGANVLTVGEKRKWNGKGCTEEANGVGVGKGGEHGCYGEGW